MEFMLTLMVLSGLSVTHASHHTTLPARKMPHQGVNTIVPLWNVKSIKFSVNLNFFYFLVHLRMAGNPGKEKQKNPQKDGKGDAQRKCGSSHKGWDLNSWDEVAMEKAWLEYKE